MSEISERLKIDEAKSIAHPAPAGWEDKQAAVEDEGFYAKTHPAVIK
jgi:hypothetical protein